MPKRAPLLAVLLCLVAVCPVVPASGNAADGTLSGRVVDDDGDPIANARVLVEAKNGSAVAEQTRRHDVVDALGKLARADPEGMWTTETDADGRYSVSLPAGEYRVVAVVDERVSHLNRVSITGAVSENLTVSRSHVLQLEGSRSTTRPNETMSVSLTVSNTDDEPVRNLTLDLAVDDGLTVVAIDAPDSAVSNETVRFRSVAAGETATVTITVRPAADAERTTADVDATVWSDTHFVDSTFGASVAIHPEGSTPTRTALPVGDHGDVSETTPSPSTNESGPGFTVGGTLVSVLAVSLLGNRLRH